MKTTEQHLTELLRKAMRDYRLIEEGDHVLVALSGGKDSLALVRLLAQRSKILMPHFSVSAVHVRMENICYESSTAYLEDFCRSHDVPLHILTTRFDASTDKRKSPCFLCSWHRRKEIFQLAQQLHCQSIALGHHKDDIVHTTLMNLAFQGRFDGMPAKLKLHKMPLHIIRPLCLCREKDIEDYAIEQGFQPQKKRCPYEHKSFREDMRNICQQLEHLNHDIDRSVWNALEREGKLVQT